MSALKVVIIEDEFFAADHLAGLIQSLGYQTAGVYHSGEAFLEKTDWDFDAAIVDIFLSEEMIGLDVAEHIQMRNRPFIFLTANKDQVTLKRAARLHPSAYISKPFNENDVQAALQIIDAQRTSNIVVKVSGMSVEVNPNDIVFVKSDGSYVEIQTTDKKYVQRKLLKDIEKELPDNFVRAHRSYIVNRDFIEKRSSETIIVNGFSVPVSRGLDSF